MTIERALVGTTDASAAASVYVEDVFSTYLYTGNGSTQTITNGIDLATKGGLVWLKRRELTADSQLFDTLRGTGNILASNQSSGASSGNTDTLQTFNTTGFSVGSNYGAGANGGSYASWTFRKQAKFFDIVTYTGNGVNEREIAHNLGCEPGLIIVKRTNTSANWKVRETQTIGSVLCLNTTDADGNTTYTGGYPALGSTPTTVFKVRDHLNPSDLSCVNASGGTYVAYLFAKSNSGGFGAAGTDSVVACGYFTADGSGNATVSLGWEPQYILWKKTSAVEDWYVQDIMRGWSMTGYWYLSANTSSSDSSLSTPYSIPTSTGFKFQSSGLTPGATYIYLAIRRPMKTPTDATKVFKTVARTGTGSSTSITGVGFAPDAVFALARSGTNQHVQDKLRGPNLPLWFAYTLAEDTAATGSVESFTNDGINIGADGYTIALNKSGNSYATTFFRRAPGFFDVVCYTGTGSATTVAHNLGVAPEFIITKGRSDGTNHWWSYHKDYPSSNFIINGTTGAIGVVHVGPSTSTNFSLDAATTYGSNSSGQTYVAYLFATCPGVSKVFSYTGNGSSQTINCGFAAGARFVLIKRTDAAGDWYVWDTARGIVSANDPHLSLNTTAAEVTTDDTIDPDSSGFIVNQVAATNVNVNNATYIGLAIA